jgi:uncharacterized membrane protein YphA (DoxX/SURF4 family)
MKTQDSLSASSLVPDGLPSESDASVGPSSGWKQTAPEAIAVLARWVLGGLFVYMGLSKAVFHDPSAFLTLVREYGIVSNPILLNSIAATLPWFEVFCGLLLLAGIAVRGAALMLVIMLVPFTLLVLRRALAIVGLKGLPFCAVKFDCGCGNGEVFVCPKLLENCLLIFLSCWLFFSRTRKLCAKFTLFH